MFLRILLLVTIIVGFLYHGNTIVENFSNEEKTSSENQNFFINNELTLLKELIEEEKINKKLTELKFSSNKLELNQKLEENNEKIFDLNLKIEENKVLKEIEKHKILKEFKNKILNKDFLVKENGVWYGYSFKNSSFFDNPSYINKKNFEHNNINPENDLLTFNDGKFIFIKNYEKYRLISDKIIYGIPGKREFLKTLLNIKFFDKTDENLDNEFLKLKFISKKINKGLDKKEDIIKKTYGYILENLKYDENIKDGNFDIFSGIKTFKNKIGVCQGYVELFNLMLAFNNIESEIIKGDVVNSEDFPKIGHAWIKIDNYYYDPTFDDPVGAKKTKEFEDYFYYKLPKDIFYTNRFEKGETPNFLKNLSLENRQFYVEQNIYSLFEKYKDKNLNLLNVVKFKKELGLSSKQKITIESIIKKYGFYNLENGIVRINGNKKYLKNMNYFEINDKNINGFLYQNKFNLKGYQIFRTKENNIEKYLISKDYSFR